MIKSIFSNSLSTHQNGATQAFKHCLQINDVSFVFLFQLFLPNNKSHRSELSWFPARSLSLRNPAMLLPCMQCERYCFGCGVLLSNAITDDVVVALLFGAKKKKERGILSWTVYVSTLGLNVRILAISVEALNFTYPMQLPNHRVVLTLGLSRSHFWPQFQLVASRCSTFAPERLFFCSSRCSQGT